MKPPLPLRLLRAASAALLGVAIFYVVGMNVFLSTSLFDRVIDGEPDTIDIHYRRGWSIFPGRIHAKNLSVRGRDGNVEWILRLDEVAFDVSFAGLAKQRFEASNVHGRGISFRLRQRLEAEPHSQAEIANLPPIDGFGAYAVRPPPHAAPEIWSDAAYHLWTVRLEGVIAEDVHEIWIDNGHFEGKTRIGGRFYLKPVRKVDIGPIRMDVREGHVRVGTTVLAERLADAVLEVAVAPFDPRKTHGMDLLRGVSLGIDMHPVIPDIARLPISLPEEVELTGATDVHRLVLKVRNAALQAGSHVDVSIPRAIVTRGENQFAGAISVTGDVESRDDKQRLDFRVALTDLDVTRRDAARGSNELLLQVPSGEVAGDTSALTFSDAFTDLHVVVGTSMGRLPSLRALSTYIPSGTPVALKDGKGEVALQFEAWRVDKTARGRATLRSDNLGLQLAQMRVQGAALVDASFGSLEWETSRMRDAKLSLRVSGGTLSSNDTPAVALVRVPEMRIDATAAAINLDDPLRALHAAIHVGRGEIVDPNLLRAYLPKETEMHVLPGRAHFSLGCDVTLADYLANGTLDVASKELGFAFRDFRIATDVRARALVRNWNWQRGDLILDRASVDLTELSVVRDGSDDGGTSGQMSRTDSWRSGAALYVGRISLGAKSSHFIFTDPLEHLDLSVSLVDGQLRDTALINALLPGGAQFVIRTKEGSLSADARVEVEDHIVQGTVLAHTANMDVATKSFHIGGDIDLLANVSDWNFVTSTLKVPAAHLRFTHVAGAFQDVRADTPGVMSVAEGAFGKSDFRAEQVELWASTPDFSLVAPSRKNLDARVVIAGAELPDVKILQEFTPKDSIVAVEFGRAQVSADVSVSQSQGTAEGRFDLALPHTGIRFHETHLSGDFELSAQLAGYDAKRSVFNLSGTRFAMRDVEVTNASTDASHWQGDLVFDEASFALEPAELDGHLSLHARDASPVLAILLGNALPKIFVGLTRMPELAASARLTMGTHHVALRDLDAHGGDIAIQGLYVLEGDHRAAAFVVEKGPFSAGFRIGDDGVHLRLFGLKSWLRDQTRLSLQLLDQPKP